MRKRSTCQRPTAPALDPAWQFARTVHPGESIDLAAGFPPIGPPGRYSLYADLIDALPIDLLDSAFVNYGSEPLQCDLTVANGPA